MHISDRNLGKKDFSKIFSRRSKGPQNRHRKIIFSPWAPVFGPQINFSYLGFLGSNLGHPKLIGLGYDICKSLYSSLWTIVTIQYRCDTSRGVIWCHDFGPTALLLRRYLKLCTLTSLGSWSSFNGMQDLYMLSIGKYIQYYDLLW